MFDFIQERKAVESLEAVAAGVVDRLAAATPVRRAAALAVANATLIASAPKWGKEVTHAPMKMSPKVAAEAVSAFANSREKLIHNSEELNGRPATDPAVDAFQWDLMAHEVLIVTLGASLNPAAASAAGKCWKRLYASRRHAENAARLMMHFSKSYSTSPIPMASKKEKLTEKKLISLASVLPPMYRPKKAKRKKP